MSNKQWLGVIVAIAVVALIAGFVGWRLGSKSTSGNETRPISVDQPIVISDGSLFIHEQNQNGTPSWSNYSGKGILPSTVSVRGAFASATISDGAATSSLCNAAPCQIDITYYYAQRAALHFTANSASAMTLTSDYDPFDTWLGYADYLMYHPKLDKISGVAVNGGNTVVYSSGRIKIRIIRQ
jgi:hypothetical protein